MRIRTIRNAIKCIRAIDPASSISEWALRGLVKSGRLPHTDIGNRQLIDLDALEDFLANPPAQPVEVETYGKIRRIGG